jgi:hypothetical protein
VWAILVLLTTSQQMNAHGRRCAISSMKYLSGKMTWHDEIKEYYDYADDVGGASKKGSGLYFGNSQTGNVTHRMFRYIVGHIQPKQRSVQWARKVVSRRFSRGVSRPSIFTGMAA